MQTVLGVQEAGVLPSLHDLAGGCPTCSFVQAPECPFGLPWQFAHGPLPLSPGWKGQLAFVPLTNLICCEGTDNLCPLLSLWLPGFLRDQKGRNLVREGGIMGVGKVSLPEFVVCSCLCPFIPAQFLEGKSVQ